ncbi:MAG: RagB/SusD family nutrient uptake outer membrane protein [Fermentimonas sp.]
MKRKIIKHSDWKRLLNMLLPALLALFLLACSEDFLKPEPLSFFSPENVYVNKAGFESGLVTVRKDLKNDFYGDMSHLQMDHVTSDFGFGIGMGDYTILTPSTGTYYPILQLFERVYGYIKSTNVIISRIDDVSWDKESDRNEILAQALFYRAWWYYRVINTYGDVPFIGHELKGPKLDFYTHSRWTILEKLISDLDFASKWLPEKTKAGVPNKYAALHFLSKLYLANADFDKAIAAASAVIDGPYSLMKERFGSDAGDPTKNVIWDLHRPQNKSIPANTEAILTLIDRESAPTGAKVWSYTMRGFHCPWWYGWVLDSEGKPGTVASGEQYQLLGRGDPDVNQSYWYSYEIWEDDTYSWKNTPDLRRASSIWWEVDQIVYNRETSVDYNKPVNPKNFSNPVDSLMIWPMPFYKTYYPHEQGFKGHPMGGNGDMYVFRLAETYLIRAEAYYWKNQLDQAAADLNVVRGRANAPSVAPSDVDIDFIFDERLRELALEEFRHTEMTRAANIMAKKNLNGYTLGDISKKNWWYDRLMKYNTWYKMGSIQGIWPTIFKTEPKYIFWPIAISVITTNTMGVINQNEGYEGAENNKPPLTVIDENEE